MQSRKMRRAFGVLIAAVIGLMVVALPGVASARDRNHDRIPDRWEKHHRLSLHKKQTRRDEDRDGLKNRQEWRAGDDPRDPDSDGDGIPDGEEGAGTIGSFTDGVLTINLFGGGSVSGLVTDATEIKCDNGDDQGDEDGDGEGGEHGDTGDGEDHSGPGEEGSDGESTALRSEDGTSGDDVGGDESGDDDQGDDDESTCSADHLTPGAVVQEAELELEGGQAIFEEIELAV